MSSDDQAKPVAVLIAEAGAKSPNLNVFHCHDCVLLELRAGESKILDNAKKRARIIRGSRQAVAAGWIHLMSASSPLSRFQSVGTASCHSHRGGLSSEGICVGALIGHSHYCAREDLPAKKPLEEAAVRGHSLLRRRLRRSDDVLRGVECCKR